MSTPLHNLLLTDGGPNTGLPSGGLTLNVMSIRNQTTPGYNVPTRQLIMGGAQQTVLADANRFGIDGSRPRSSRLENRDIRFKLDVLGTSVGDVHARYGALGTMAEKIRRYWELGEGWMPYLKWKAHRNGRALYTPVYAMHVEPSDEYAGPPITSNIITDAQVVLSCSPEFEGYYRPIFAANNPATGDLIGARDSGTTVGYALNAARSPVDYLGCYWLHGAIDPNGSGGWLTMWVRADWVWGGGSDAQTRSFFSFVDGVADRFWSEKDAAGNWNVHIHNADGTVFTLTLNPTQVKSIWDNAHAAGQFVGLHAHWTTYWPAASTSGGFRAYLFSDGSISTDGSAMLLEFTGTYQGFPFAPISLPDRLYIGCRANSGTGGAEPLVGNVGATTVEVDSIEVGDYIGFQCPSDPAMLPYTRDPGSVQVLYPRTITQVLDGAAGLGSQWGNLQTYLRRPAGDRPGLLDMRIRSATGGADLGRLRAWLTKHATDGATQTSPYTFINTVGASFFNDWSSQANGGALAGTTVAQSGTVSTNTGSPVDPCWAKTVFMNAQGQLALAPGTYLVLVRIAGSTTDEYNVAVGFSLGNILQMLPRGGFATQAVAGAGGWAVVPVGVIELPLAGSRPGGTSVFDVQVRQAVVYIPFGEARFDTAYCDGVFLLPITPEQQPAQLMMALGAPLVQSTMQLEHYADRKPYWFRTVQSNGQDYSRDFLQVNGRLRTLPGGDNRLWLLAERQTPDTYQVRGDNLTLDAWVRPRWRELSG
jgi:hypothetical protein